MLILFSFVAECVPRQLLGDISLSTHEAKRRRPDEGLKWLGLPRVVSFIMSRVYYYVPYTSDVNACFFKSWKSIITCVMQRHL